MALKSNQNRGSILPSILPRYNPYSSIVKVETHQTRPSDFSVQHAKNLVSDFVCALSILYRAYCTTCNIVLILVKTVTRTYVVDQNRTTEKAGRELLKYWHSFLSILLVSIHQDNELHSDIAKFDIQKSKKKSAVLVPRRGLNSLSKAETILNFAYDDWEGATPLWDFEGLLRIFLYQY
jgi:hypothetical protein